MLSKAPALIFVVFMAPLAFLLGRPEIRQNPAYHNFADKMTLLSVPHFFDVSTNLFFLAVAAYGIWRFVGEGKEELSKLAFLVGVLFIAPGSAYYHWNPNNETLVWDRLPMVIAFCSLTCWVIVNYFKLRGEKKILALFNGVGLASVVYWVYVGDLRFYYWVQLVPILLLFYLSLFGAKVFNHRALVFGAFAFYVAAKMTEDRDVEIFNILGFSGHSLKHILAAAAVLMLVHLEFDKKKGPEGPEILKA